MKVFLAIPYSQLCDSKEYKVKDKYMPFFIKLTSSLKRENIDYFLAHEREKWGKDFSSSEESTIIDFETIKSVDLICAIPGVPNSGGVHVEMGWASANHKKIKIFLKKDYNYSPMILGLHCLTDIDYYYYNVDYSEQLADLIVCEILKFKSEQGL